MRDDGAAERTAGDGTSSCGDAAPYVIGAEVLASGGESCGVLRRVIIDPVARALTHLVVAPRHHEALGRLVPVGLVETSGDRICLGCAAARFHELDDAEDIRFVPASSNPWGYESGQANAWAYYELGMSTPGVGAGEMGFGGGPVPIVSDRVPLGEVQVQRGDRVHASDGWIGAVQGLVIDPADHHVTHVLLQEGHLLGRKQVAIPIGTTARLEDGIRVQLTRQQVHDLPPVELSSGFEPVSDRSA